MVDLKKLFVLMYVSTKVTYSIIGQEIIVNEQPMMNQVIQNVKKIFTVLKRETWLQKIGDVVMLMLLTMSND
jgi:hypothetical protein